MQKLVTPFAIALLFFASCSKNEEIILPNSFAGNWNNVENTSVTGTARYPVAIEAIEDPTILFSYLYGFQEKITATVSDNSFEIPTQIIEGSSVSGSGVKVTSSQINMSYVVDNGLFKDTVSAVLTQ